jgi:hypothetical protein
VCEHANHTWEYLKHKDLIKGLPIAAISGATAAYLLGCAHPAVGFVFGIVNYITVASLSTATNQYENSNEKAATIIGSSYVISTAFMQTVLKASLSYKAAVPLALAAALGYAMSKGDQNYMYGMCEGGPHCTLND